MIGAGSSQIKAFEETLGVRHFIRRTLAVDLGPERLGRINNVNRSKYGVGVLIYPYGSVRPGIETIMSGINGGAKFFFQSDISC